MRARVKKEPVIGRLLDRRIIKSAIMRPIRPGKPIAVLLKLQNIRKGITIIRFDMDIAFAIRRSLIPLVVDLSRIRSIDC